MNTVTIEDANKRIHKVFETVKQDRANMSKAIDMLHKLTEAVADEGLHRTWLFGKIDSIKAHLAESMHRY